MRIIIIAPLEIDLSKVLLVLLVPFTVGASFDLLTERLEHGKM